MAAMSNKPIRPGMTLLFLDEIQECPQAIMSLRFLKEDMPDFFGVGRIHSMFMYPMTFDEFLKANGEHLLIDVRNQASSSTPLLEPLHEKLVRLLRVYMLVGGMPEVVAKWVETQDFLQCQEVQDDIIVSYEDDSPKYRKRIEPALLRQTMRSAAVQVTDKFVYSQVGGGYKTGEVKKALDLLILAGILIPVTYTDANGLPLGSETDDSYRKILPLDPGLMLRLLNMTIGNVVQITSQILTVNATELVNKGPMAEMVVGLELLRYQTPNLRHELFYWVRQAKNSQAEIDYVVGHIQQQRVLPVEVKAGTQGGMKSLWIFMREKHLVNAVRCSLENFGSFEYYDKESTATRRVDICPIYAVSMMPLLFIVKSN